MSAAPQRFKLTEVARLIKATVMAGLTVRGVTTNRDGRPLVITNQRAAAEAADDTNPWDRVLTKDAPDEDGSS